jgi:hypothetical protein
MTPAVRGDTVARMTTHDLSRSLPTLFRELVYGAGDTGFMLNPHDPGMLASLARLSAEDAGASTQGGATIAAHVEHVRFGLSLMNRWAGGDADPFTGADWGAAWRTARVTPAEWERLKAGLREQADRWLDALAQPRDVEGIELDALIASVAHLAYHLGAIRQIQAATRGPRDGTGA